MSLLLVLSIPPLLPAPNPICIPPWRSHSQPGRYAVLVSIKRTMSPENSLLTNYQLMKHPLAFILASPTKTMLLGGHHPNFNWLVLLYTNIRFCDYFSPSDKPVVRCCYGAGMFTSGRAVSSQFTCYLLDPYHPVYHCNYPN